MNAYENALKSGDEGGGVVQAFGAVEFHAEVGGGFVEGYVDVVEDFYVVAEEADGLHDDAFVAGGGEGFECVFYGGADPGSAGDALALEGEEPVVGCEADDAEKVGDGGGGLFALYGVGVGVGVGGVVLDAVGWDRRARVFLLLRRIGWCGRGRSGR